MINVLIRHTKGRKEELKKCLQSIADQTYQDLNVIICTDDEEFVLPPDILNGIPREVFYTPSDGIPFHWNLYCNQLKDRVENGWFFYCDDDDWLVDKHCLKKLSPHLLYPYQAVICQFMRGIRRKPDYRQAFQMKPEHIIRGKIGGSAIFLHHTQKNVANWDGQRAADFRFIRDVVAKIPMVFVPIPVVQAGNNGRKGK